MTWMRSYTRTASQRVWILANMRSKSYGSFRKRRWQRCTKDVAVPRGAGQAPGDGGGMGWMGEVPGLPGLPPGWDEKGSARGDKRLLGLRLMAVTLRVLALLTCMRVWYLLTCLPTCSLVCRCRHSWRGGCLVRSPWCFRYLLIVAHHVSCFHAVGSPSPLFVRAGMAATPGGFYGGRTPGCPPLSDICCVLI